jgi:uncharacterized cysteine cluster protein YcgN (CxxCxxCC family)
MKSTAAPSISADTAEIRLKDDWEGLCHQCGQCCFEKWVEEDGTIHPTVIACRFLDIHSRQCRVYHKRFEVGEGCLKLTPEVVEVVQWLPEDCGYVVNLRMSRKK